MKRSKIILALTGIAFVASSYASRHASYKHYVWNKTPIEVNLPVGKKLAIQFNDNIKLLKPVSNVQIQKLGDTLYLKALSEFDAKDIYIKDEVNDVKIIVTLSADSKNNDTSPVYIQIPERGGVNYKQDNSSAESINYISITRYAIQRLYSEDRLLTNLSSIYRVPMKTQRQVSLIYGSNIVSSPIASWTSNGLYVTAISLKNLDDEQIQLDPRRSLKGVWKTAVFYPSNSLAPKGHRQDTTTVFLTSNVPFVESLNQVRGVYR